MIYYVAKNGKDEKNSGTSLDSPFLTIQKAIHNAKPGDSVCICRGDYREQIEVTGGGGNPENYVRIELYQNEEVTIKGSDVVKGWELHSDHIWKKVNWNSNSQQVFDDGAPLQQIGNLPKHPASYYTPIGKSIDDMFPGSFYYDDNPSKPTLYVYLADYSDHNKSLMEVSTRRRILFMHDGNDYFYFKNLKFRHSNVTEKTQQDSSVYIEDNSVIENCDIQWTDFAGLGLGHYSKSINCIISNNGCLGIAVYKKKNFLIKGCTISDNNYRRFNSSWVAGGIKAVACSWGTAEDNEFHSNKGSGIWFDHANSKEGVIVIRKNYIHDNGMSDGEAAGIFIEASGNAIIYNNVLVNTKRRGIYLSGSNNVMVYNNTLVKTLGYAGIDMMVRHGNFPLENNRIYNNIIWNTAADSKWPGYDLHLSSENGVTVKDNKCDYNLIYRDSDYLKLAYNNRLYNDLESLHVDTTYDCHSISEPPDFVTASGDDFSLSM